MSDGAEQSKPTVVLPRADSIDGFQTDPASSPVAAGKPWVVLKFGGTSVSSGSTWKQIIARVKELREEMDCKIFLVLSALSQVTNSIEKCLTEAVEQQELTSLQWIEDTHRRLAREVGLDAQAINNVLECVREMENLLQGISMVGEVSPRVKARMCSYGEQMSTRMAVHILRVHGVKASLVQSGDLLVTDTPLNAMDEDKYLNANIYPRSEREWAESVIQEKAEPFSQGVPDVVVTQGFIARNVKGETCLLGRGGSDTSGSLIAALVAAHHLEIWTDVYGMFTGDPRSMPHVRLIQKISWREAQELATSGAKVLHPRCIGPAAMFNVPIEIRNTMDPASQHTLITVDDFQRFSTGEQDEGRGRGPPSSGNRSPWQSPYPSPRQSPRQSPRDKTNAVQQRRTATNNLPPAFCGVVSQSGCIMITLTTMEMWGATGFLVNCFNPFREFSISVDQVATSQSGVSVTISHVPGGIEGDSFQGLLASLRRLGEVTVEQKIAVVTVVGRKIRKKLQELGKAMEAFAEVEVLMVSASSEDVAMSFVVREEKAKLLVEVLHHELIPVTGGDEMFGDTYKAIKEKDAMRRVSMEVTEAAAAAQDARLALLSIQGLG
eukprot:CAMPEP_0177696412 /NCGR_PEP_ID=MMETSP0484_2-20121128/3966_1 /TAXON_ID=354590 /ORGANISM="Rhodomonas lens, Strain RHODO" /LENGTH=606 /DNA_ID=CAMNT_0019207381 /DNA_START=194 /DNA_END=2014 /DNA_ORIENTATION=+